MNRITHILQEIRATFFLLVGFVMLTMICALTAWATLMRPMGVGRATVCSVVRYFMAASWSRFSHSPHVGDTTFEISSSEMPDKL